MKNGNSIENILETIKKEIDAVSKNDFAAYRTLLTKDAVFLPPNSTSKTGEELLQWLKEFLENFIVEWQEFKHINTEAVDTLGFHEYSFRWKVTSRKGSEPKESRGGGIHILRLQKDGSWKIAREIWNNYST